MNGKSTSPQPSVDRLSVTFAEPVSLASTTVNLFNSVTETPITNMWKHKSREDSEEEDYSASVRVVMSRRGSKRGSRRGNRRLSSICDHDNISRRFSMNTNSSMDSISAEEGYQMPMELTTQNQIFSSLSLHKEVLGTLKYGPWSMKRKLKLVRKAKCYIKDNEGALQSRLAQSKSTRDILARFNILLVSKWQRVKREAANLSNLLIPWEVRIKEIESHFGSVVASYFTFLRWLFWVNLIITSVLVLFVIVPEVMIADRTKAGTRKFIPEEEKNKSTNFLTLWQFEGVLKVSPFFYGYYTNVDSGHGSYRLPFAYFMTGLAVYVYSFVATLKKMAENSRMSKLSEKEDECTFSWKLFTGWDFMIGNAETAHNRTASIILSFKEALLEEAEKKKDPRNWKFLSLRLLVNICVMILLIVSAYAVVSVVKRSKEANSESNWWRQNETTVVMSLISFIFPIFFELLGYMEHYHPRKQLRVQLARIMLLNLLNLYSLIFASFSKIDEMTNQLETLQNLKANKFESEQNETRNFKELLLGETFHEVVAFENSSYICYTSSMECPQNGNYLKASALLREEEFIASTAESDQYNWTSSLPYISSTTQNEDIIALNRELTKLKQMYPVEDTTSDDSYEYELNETYEYMLGKNEDETTTTKENVMSTNFLQITVSDDYDQVNLTESPTTSDFTSTSSNGYEITNTINLKMDAYSDVEAIGDEGTSPYTKVTESDKSFTEQTATSIFEDVLDKTTASNVEETTDHIITSKSDLTEELDGKNPQRSMCFEMKCFEKKNDSIETTNEPFTTEISLNIYNKEKLLRLCWETTFGQELVKLTMMDLLMTVFATLFMDFFRALFVRGLNKIWCWDLEKKFPQYGDFKIAENILHLVNNQGMVWMGMFFSPGLVLINLIKLVIMMYLRSWAVMTCNVPHEVVFRASRSNNFYLALLLTMLFLCVLPVGYAIVWVKPSLHCGPFSDYDRIYHILTKNLNSNLPKTLKWASDYIASPGIVIPLLVLLILIIYYLTSLTNSLREANNDLKIQLRRERTEERRKMFKMADFRRKNGSPDMENAAFARWKKFALKLGKSTESVEKKSGDNAMDSKAIEKNKGDYFTKIVKMALSGQTSRTNREKRNVTTTTQMSETNEVLKFSQKYDVAATYPDDFDVNSVIRERSNSKTKEDMPRDSISSVIPIIKISSTDNEDDSLKDSESVKEIDQPVATSTKALQRRNSIDDNFDYENNKDEENLHSL